MIIQDSTAFAKVNKKAESKIGGFIADDGHHIAVSSEVSKALGVVPISPLKIGTGFMLHPVTGDNSILNVQQESEIKEAIDNFRKTFFPLLKKNNPELTGVIGAVELVFATREVIEAITDKESDSKVKPWIAGGKAVMKLLSAVDPIFPQIKQIPHFETFSVIFTIGTSAYQIYCDVSKDESKEQPKIIENPYLKIKNATD